MDIDELFDCIRGILIGVFVLGSGYFLWSTINSFGGDQWKVWLGIGVMVLGGIIIIGRLVYLAFIIRHTFSRR